MLFSSCDPSAELVITQMLGYGHYDICVLACKGMQLQLQCHQAALTLHARGQALLHPSRTRLLYRQQLAGSARRTACNPAAELHTSPHIQKRVHSPAMSRPLGLGSQALVAAAAAAGRHRGPFPRLRAQQPWSPAVCAAVVPPPGHFCAGKLQQAVGLHVEGSVGPARPDAWRGLWRAVRPLQAAGVASAPHRGVWAGVTGAHIAGMCLVHHATSATCSGRSCPWQRGSSMTFAAVGAPAACQCFRHSYLQVLCCGCWWTEVQLETLHLTLWQ